MVREPTKIFHENCEMLKYFPVVLRELNCTDPAVCRGHEEKFCYQWFIATCINRQHYEHMLEEVRYVHKVFKQVRDTFYQAISHVSDRSKQDEGMHSGGTPTSPRMSRAEASYLEQDMSSLINGKNRTKRFLEWGAIIGIGYGVYSNAKDIKTIKNNIKILQKENKRQYRNIMLLAKFLGATIARVRLHDVMLERLSARLIQ